MRVRVPFAFFPVESFLRGVAFENGRFVAVGRIFLSWVRRGNRDSLKDCEGNKKFCRRLGRARHSVGAAPWIQRSERRALPAAEQEWSIET